MKDSEYALKFSYKSLNIFRKINGTDYHIDNANVLLVIGNILASQNQLHEALAYCEQSFKNFRRVYGTDDHEHITMALNHLLKIKQNQKKFEETEEIQVLSEKIKIMCRKIYGTDFIPKAMIVPPATAIADCRKKFSQRLEPILTLNN